jgi:hypothetical protein
MPLSFAQRLVRIVFWSLAATPALASAPLSAVRSATAAGADDAGDAGSACEVWDVGYLLGAKLRLSDTPHGAGDGVYEIGPGEVTLRFDNVNGAPGGNVQMRSYHMRDHFTIKSTALFLSAKVITRTDTRATPNRCGSAAEGELQGGALNWESKVRGYKTAGTLTCEGSLCGKFGAPPTGMTQLNIGPNDVAFNAFKFNPDRTRFTMDFARVAKTEMPKQTAAITLAGRQASRRCVPKPPPCR